MADEKVIGAYICKGCGLGDRLDTSGLMMIAEREAKANIVKEHDFLCSAEGVAMIQNDIDNEGVNRVAICACSRRAKTEAFSFENVAITRGNLREGVIWVRPDTDDNQETTQEMAADYVRMAVFEAKFMTPPHASGEATLNKTLTVVGGGFSGMTSAIEASKAGFKVNLIEKTGSLGGVAGQLYKRIPDHAPYADPQDSGIDALAAAIEADRDRKSVV